MVGFSVFFVNSQELFAVDFLFPDFADKIKMRWGAWREYLFNRRELSAGETCESCFFA